MAKFTIVTPFFWPEIIGSAPYCTDLALWLKARGHDVNILTRRPHYPRSSDFLAWADGSRDQEEYAGLAIHRFAALGLDDGGFGRRILNDFSFLFGLLHQSSDRSGGHDVIIVFVPSSLALFGAKLLARKSSARLVCVVHDIESGLAGNINIPAKAAVLAGARIVERVGLNLCDEVIALTEGMRDALQRLGCRQPISVVPIWSSEICEEYAQPTSSQIIIAYSGNFGSKQNIDQLLPLFRLLQDRLPNVLVHMRGAGSERRRIEMAVAQMKLTNVRFLPLVPKELLKQSILDTTLQIVPQAVGSADYAFPSKLITIMSAGRPYLCIAEPDSSIDIITRQSRAGVCVPAGDDQAIFTAINSMINNPENLVRMGQNGINYVKRFHSRSVIFPRYESIIYRASSSNNFSYSSGGGASR